MQEEALQQFLSSVRCARFIDYLDPIGETAEEALARRVRWARMTRNDPAHADEAMFLLQHEGDLKSVVTRELDAESGWSPLSGAEVWNDEPHEVGGTLIPDDMDDFDDDMESIGDPPSPLGDTDPIVPSGIMRMEDITLDEPLPPLKPRVGPSARNVGTKDTLDNERATASVPPGLLQSRGKVRTASPAVRRVSAPTLSAPLDMPTIPPLDEIEQRRQAAIQADREATDPSARPTPDLAKAIALAASTRTVPTVDEAASTAPTAPLRQEPAHAETSDEGGLPWLPIAGVAAVVLLLGAALFVSLGEPDAPTRPHGGISVAAPPPAPVAPSVTPTPEAPSPAVVPTQATPRPAPEPVVPAPEPVAAPAPAPVVTPAPVEAAPPEPTEAVPAPPEPIAEAPPEPTEVAPAPTPEVVPPPEPDAPAQQDAPEVAPDTPPATPAEKVVLGDMKGLWGGSVGSQGFILRIQSQTGERFTASAEILANTGASQRYQVSGSFDGDKVQFGTSAGVSFSGTASAKAMQGTMRRDGASESWSVTR